MSTRNATRRLEAWLRAHRPDYLDQLRPGATDRQLDEVEVAIGAELPRAFRELYQWRNGQPRQCYDGFVNNRMFASLESALDTWNILTPMIGRDFPHPSWWRRSWIPFLDNGGGDHLVVDLEGCFGGVPGQVLYFWHDWEDRSIVAPSVESWLEHLVEALESGVLVCDEEEGTIREADALGMVSWVGHVIEGYPIEVNLDRIGSA